MNIISIRIIVYKTNIYIYNINSVFYIIYFSITTCNSIIPLYKCILYKIHIIISYLLHENFRNLYLGILNYLISIH